MARPQTVTDTEILEVTRALLAEQGPGVSLATIGRALGVSAPALIKRFGSKEELVFRALLPPGPPVWREALERAPGADPRAELISLLGAREAEFFQVAPALAALRMSRIPVERVFPEGRPSPPVLARSLLADWLRRAGVAEPCEVRADALVGAVEARGFLRWVGPHMVGPEPVELWAAALVAVVLGGGPGG